MFEFSFDMLHIRKTLCMTIVYGDITRIRIIPFAIFFKYNVFSKSAFKTLFLQSTARTISTTGAPLYMLQKVYMPILDKTSLIHFTTVAEDTGL